MKVLIACEESQTVCKAFRALGHEAYSCDVQEPSGGHPEWHIWGDALEAVKGGEIATMDGQRHDICKWGLLIAHPPCTYLTSCSAVWLFNADHTVKDLARERKGWEAKEFFLALLRCGVERIAVENPTPLRYFGLPRYDQIIEPYMFGDPWRKRTCLWLRGLPPLRPTNTVSPPLWRRSGEVISDENAHVRKTASTGLLIVGACAVNLRNTTGSAWRAMRIEIASERRRWPCRRLAVPDLTAMRG